MGILFSMVVLKDELEILMTKNIVSKEKEKKTTC